MPYSSAQSRLDYVIANGILPDGIKSSAKQVLARLDQQIRIVLLGMPGSGKTAVLNLLLGQDLIPDGIQNLPTIHVVSGTVPQMVCTLPDGSKKTIPGIDLTALQAVKPLFVTVEADYPALSKISLLDIVASDNISQQRKAINWASNRADVMIWCTTAFTDIEQDLWYDVPDHLKDNSYLLLTKTDLLAGQSGINTRLAELAKSSGEEFLRVLPLSAKNALSIRAAKANMNMAAFKATGASALIAAVMSQIENNQRAAQDHAEQILAQYGSEVDFSALAKEQASPPPSPVQEPETEPDAEVVSEEAAPEQEVAPEQLPPAEEPPQDPEPPQEDQAKSNHVALEQALAEVVGCEQELIGILEAPDQWPVERALTICEKAASALPEILDEDSSPAISAICSSAFEIQDIIMLMNSEGGENSEDNAITLILQIRREIEALVAQNNGKQS